MLNNPNHRGYSSKPKQVTQADVRSNPGIQEVNLLKVLDPKHHAKSFAENVVGAVSNTFSGIFRGGGEQFERE